MRGIKLSLAVVLLAGCGGGGKSVFDLTEDDFETKRDELVTTSSPSVATLDVTKGDVVLVKATGSLETRLGTIGPEGSQSWGGSSYAFVNRRAYGLFGRINHQAIYLGKETVLIAPETGTLEVLVNGCTATPTNPDAGIAADCSTTGHFNVALHSKLKGGVTLATSPSVADNTVTKTSTTQLSPVADWTRSGVKLKKGQKVRLSALGTFEVSGREPGTVESYTADGKPSGSISGLGWVMSNRFVHRLYGRVDGNVIELGTSATFLSPAAGELELVVNHRDTDTSSSSLSVTIEEGIVPARGLFLDEAAAWTAHGPVNVPGSGKWVATPVTVTKGEPIFFSATGQLSGSGIGPTALGPWGEGSVGGGSYALTNRPRFALFGRVGTQAFFVGAENAVLAPDDGVLELVVNHVPDCDAATLGDRCDVSGAFDVKISTP